MGFELCHPAVNLKTVSNLNPYVKILLLYEITLSIQKLLIL